MIRLCRVLHHRYQLRADRYGCDDATLDLAILADRYYCVESVRSTIELLKGRSVKCIGDWSPAHEAELAYFLGDGTDFKKATACLLASDTPDMMHCDCSNRVKGGEPTSRGTIFHVSQQPDFRGRLYEHLPL